MLLRDFLAQFNGIPVNSECRADGIVVELRNRRIPYDGKNEASYPLVVIRFDPEPKS